MHGAPHRVVHYPNGSVVLVQYESKAELQAEDVETAYDPVKSLRYFTGLYHEMGFHEVEGRLVYLSDEPQVIRVV
jgi:hypothetical protein